MRKRKEPLVIDGRLRRARRILALPSPAGWGLPLPSSSNVERFRSSCQVWRRARAREESSQRYPLLLWPASVTAVDPRPSKLRTS